MTTLTVTSKGQVTLNKEVLQHLGIAPGEKIELDLLPNGQGVLKAAKTKGSMRDFVDLLAGKSGKAATLAEIDDASKQGWASRLLR
jgi:bifunctional DNA-binding transcriptional regulator/antitoxin component of YhaV-PrlF toxin-antitoxin module